MSHLRITSLLLLLLSGAPRAWAEGPVEKLTNPEPLTIHAIKAATGVALYFALNPSSGEVQTAQLTQFSAAYARKAFEVPDFAVMDPVVVNAPAGATDKTYAYFTMVEKNVADDCRKIGWDIYSCPGALEKRTVGIARFNGNGWIVKNSIFAAKNTGDGTSPYAAAAVVRGHEVWLYYITAKRDPALAGVFRQKLAADGETLVGDPERVLFENAPASPSFDRLDLVQLKCDGDKAPHVITMVAALRAQSGLPFLISADGLHFRQEADSVVQHNESPITAAVQLPVNAAGGDCGNFTARHQTRREILYGERKVSGAWAVLQASVSVSVSGTSLPGTAPAEPEPEPVAAAAAASNSSAVKCTAADYLRAHPTVALNPGYAQNPMMHFLVYGKDEGACEPSLPPAKATAP